LAIWEAVFLLSIKCYPDNDSTNDGNVLVSNNMWSNTLYKCEFDVFLNKFKYVAITLTIIIGILKKLVNNINILSGI
jgi:hypothetical protein